MNTTNIQLRVSHEHKDRKRASESNKLFLTFRRGRHLHTVLRRPASSAASSDPAASLSAKRADRCASEARDRDALDGSPIFALPCFFFVFWCRAATPPLSSRPVARQAPAKRSWTRPCTVDAPSAGARRGGEVAPRGRRGLGLPAPADERSAATLEPKSARCCSESPWASCKAPKSARAAKPPSRTKAAVKPRAACVSHVMMRRCHLKPDVASAFRQLSFYPISLHQRQRLQSRL